jgi:hypothetical protein
MIYCDSENLSHTFLQHEMCEKRAFNRLLSASTYSQRRPSLITLLNCHPQRKEINFNVPLALVLYFIQLVVKGIVNLTHRVLRISFPLSRHDSFKQE